MKTRRQSNEELELRLAELEEESNLWQEKGPIAHNASSAITGLAFNNLEIGKTYRYAFYGYIGGSGPANYNITFNQAVGASEVRLTDSDGQGGSFFFEKVFVATATTMVPTMAITDAGAGIVAFARLEELARHTVTTQWT